MTSLSTSVSTPSDSAPFDSLAPWRSPLAHALHRNRSLAFSRYLQLATVRADGTPANRTVVFRGFFAKTNQLMFIADARSEKTDQIAHHAAAEACWYFTKTREQFRLLGDVRLVTANSEQTHLSDARTQLWQTISDTARLQFAWPQPKAPRSPDAAFSPPALDAQTPPSSFSLLLLAVSQVDHLALRGDPQSRCLYEKLTSSDTGDARNHSEQESEQRSEQWQVTEVNP